MRVECNKCGKLINQSESIRGKMKSALSGYPYFCSKKCFEEDKEFTKEFTVMLWICAIVVSAIILFSLYVS